LQDVRQIRHGAGDHAGRRPVAEQAGGDQQQQRQRQPATHTHHDAGQGLEPRRSVCRGGLCVDVAAHQVVGLALRAARDDVA
jgi:hypothetical protein